MKIPYYPGCTLKTHAKNFEDSALTSAKALGIEFQEFERWNCCGVVSSLTSDDLMRHLAPVRNLIRVQDIGQKEVVTLCSMCYHTLKRSNQLVKENPDKLKTMNDFMDRENEYTGGVEVKHYLEILRDMGWGKIKKKVKKKLKDLKVSPYYGCVILRPEEIGIDDPESPTIMGDLIKAMGADVIDTPYTKLCCGSYQSVTDKESSAELCHTILNRARENGAEIIITTCPLCAFNLDNRQQVIKKLHPDFKEMPVVYFTQLLALALGAEESALGLGGNAVDAKPLLLSKKLLTKTKG